MIKERYQKNASLLVLLLGSFYGCTTSFLQQTITTQSSSTPGITSSSSYVISNVSANSAAQGASSYTITVYFDSTKSAGQISSVCSVSGTSGSPATCNCQFVWNENNQSNSSNISLTRKITTPVTQVQPNVVTCSAPSVYSSEIPDKTQINVSILPAPTSNTYFKTNTYVFTKNGAVVSGSFQDAAGHIFDNILHYSCYQTVARGLSIQSKLVSLTNQSTGQNLSAPLATQYCISTAGGQAQASADCPNLPGLSYSSQANYYHFYIRNSERGDVNQFNLQDSSGSPSYVCPLVKEALNSSNTVGTSNQPWPFDATFALSLGPTSDFPVGVVANIKLKGSSSDTGNACYPTSGSSTSVDTGTVTSSSSFVTSCLGFAAQANSDGTCPSLTDSSGLSRQTFRLRRYVAIYPPVYDTNGKLLAGQSQGLDTIYVLDRPVLSSSNSNPLKPYTMLGPKPCPFAYFDKNGVTTGSKSKPAYVGTPSTLWDGKNVDAIEFPNRDLSALSGGPSCSSVIAVPNDSRSGFGLLTVNQYATQSVNFSQFSQAFPQGGPLNHLYVRPSRPFLPHYEEDTDFKACAPQAAPLVDPPLHFAKDAVTGNVAWCSESYPTQNPNIIAIDPAVTPSASPSVPSGLVSNYTSHVVKNSSSAACAATKIKIPSPASTPAASYNYDQAIGVLRYASHLPSTPWPPGGSGNAGQTCDRTVSSGSLSWTLFPLLAPEGDIENSITQDSSYMCLVTYDNNGVKTGNITPASGCCDSSSVRVPTGPTPAGSPTAAHLEPDMSCRPPSYQ